jgi:hypothetical protein
MSISALFLIVALILFILGAINVPSTRVNLVSAGLACVVASMLAGSLVLH